MQTEITMKNQELQLMVTEILYLKTQNIKIHGN